MPSPALIEQQINRIIRYMIRTGLSNDQQDAFIHSPTPAYAEVTFPNAMSVKTGLKFDDYIGIYNELLRNRSFNLKMIDGALIQMMYEFRNGVIAKHKLAFYSSPNVEQFQGAEIFYIDDEIDFDVIENYVTPFIFRFDFDSTVGAATKMPHPLSHLTLADYSNCRIPVSAPLTPAVFLSFVVQNFYDTPDTNYSAELPIFNARFAETIRPAEENSVHVVLPT